MIHNNLGAALASLDRFSEAIPHYENSLRLKPDFADSMKNPGRAFQAVGSPNQGIEQYRRAIKASPKDYLLHTNLGNGLAQRGLYDEAEASFKEAIRLKPDQASAAYNGMATLYAVKGKFEKALDMRKKAIGIDPNDGEAPLPACRGSVPP